MSVTEGADIEAFSGTFVATTSLVIDGRVEGVVNVTLSLTGKSIETCSVSASCKVSLKSIMVDSKVDEGISSKLEKLVIVKN